MTINTNDCDVRFSDDGKILERCPMEFEGRFYIPNSVTAIGDGAFCECEDLKYLDIPESVTSIGDRAFYGCKNLRILSIPDSVKVIGKDALVNCLSLLPYIIEPLKEKYDDEFNNWRLPPEQAIPTILGIE